MMLLSLAPQAGADTPGAAANDAAHCANPQTLDLMRLLPPPPTASAEQRVELAQMLRIQARRTPAEVARARADVQVSIFRFADALGNPQGFTPERLPHLMQLFRDLYTDELAILDAKDRFARPRPFTQEPRLSPVVDKPKSFSYPSGHSTWGTAAGLVLADMVPERRVRILRRAQEYAHNRIVGGVHYPSDVEAGRLAGTALAAVLFDCPAFVSEEAEAKAELRELLGLH